MAAPVTARTDAARMTAAFSPASLATTPPASAPIPAAPTPNVRQAAHTAPASSGGVLLWQVVETAADSHTLAAPSTSIPSTAAQMVGKTARTAHAAAWARAH